MAKKKKTMSKAQAAAARKEVTAESIAKARSQETLKGIRATQQRVQRESSKPWGLRFGVMLAVVAIVVIGALVFTTAPGLFVGGPR